MSKHADGYKIMIKSNSILYRKTQMYLNEKMVSYNLSSGQAAILLVAYDHPGIMQNQIGEKLDLDKSTVAKTIGKLEQDGYITRSVNPNDSRSFYIYPTQKTIDIYPTIMEIGTSWKKELAKGLTDIEYDIFMQLLKRVTANATKYFE